MSSILTNTSAMTALQTLQQTNKSLEQTQNRISTGLKVANAKDNASFWAVSTTMKSDVSTFKAISENLSLASASIGTARAGAEGIADLVKEIKDLTTRAQDSSLDKAKLQADIDANLEQIAESVRTANFNGVNLLDSDETIRLLSSVGRGEDGVDASFIELAAQNLSLGQGGGLESLNGLSVLDRGDGLFENESDGKVVHKVDLSGGTYDGSSADKGAAGADLTVAYKDADGVDRTTTITLTKDIQDYDTSTTAAGDDFAALLSGNDELASVFDFTSTGTGLDISAKSRASGVEITSLSLGGGTVLGSGGTDEGLAAKLDQEIGFEFKDAPLRAGEQFNFEFAATGTGALRNFELSFTVVEGKDSGDILDTSGTGTASDPFKINLALDADKVAFEHATGDQIAAEFDTAIAALAGSASTATVEAAFADVLTANAGAADNLIDFSTTDNVVTVAAFASVNQNLDGVTVPQTDYDALLDTIDGALETAVNAAATLGSSQKRLDIQQEFLSTLTDNLESGIGTLVDANMNEESARLQALQVQQQLGIQALSIANQAPQQILSLFR